MNQALAERDHIDSIIGRGPGDPDMHGYPGQAQQSTRSSISLKPQPNRYWDILPSSYCTVNLGDHFPKIIYNDFGGLVAQCACGAKTRSRIYF